MPRGVRWFGRPKAIAATCSLQPERKDLGMSGLVKSAKVTRRSLVAGSVMAAAACTAPLTHAFAANEAASATAIPTFLVKPDPISDFAEEFEFDVVVVGAGESGLSAVHSALAAGATVACLQNADAPFTTGNMSACVDLDQTSAAGQAAIASFINWRIVKLSATAPPGRPRWPSCSPAPSSACRLSGGRPSPPPPASPSRSPCPSGRTP